MIFSQIVFCLRYFVLFQTYVDLVLRKVDSQYTLLM